MECNPLVSIIIPVYNGSRYLREAIDSALAQTYRNVEVIVINDGSNDNGESERIAKEYDGKIRYFYKDNGGVATALNYGIRKMKGQYFSWLSHDDVYYPNKIKEQVKIIKRKNLEKTIIYTDYTMIDHSSTKIGEVKVYDNTLIPLKFELLRSHPINGCTLLIPRECFFEVGLFDETLITTQDYHMWFRLSSKYSFVHLPMFTLKSRQHNEQGSKTIPSHSREVENLYINAMRNLSIYELHSSINIKFVELFFAELAIIYRRNAYFEASNFALKLFNNSLSPGYDYSMGKILQKKDLVIFGAGEIGEKIFKDLNNIDKKVCYFLDNDSKKWGEYLMNTIIHPPSILKNLNREHLYIIIATTNYLDIGNQLVRMGYNADDFCTILDLKLYRNC